MRESLTTSLTTMVCKTCFSKEVSVVAPIFLQRMPDMEFEQPEAENCEMLRACLVRRH